MKRFSRILGASSALAVLLLAGCSTLAIPEQGTSETDLISMRGTPTYTSQDGGIKTLEWTASNSNQYTYMAKVGPDGKMISFDQVLTVERFATLKPGVSTKDDVIKVVGHPNKFESEYLKLSDSEVWTYRYKESGVWDSLMHIHFDHNGLITRLENGLDPLYLRE